MKRQIETILWAVPLGILVLFSIPLYFLFASLVGSVDDLFNTIIVLAAPIALILYISEIKWCRLRSRACFLAQVFGWVMFLAPLAEGVLLLVATIWFGLFR